MPLPFPLLFGSPAPPLQHAPFPELFSPFLSAASVLVPALVAPPFASESPALSFPVLSPVPSFPVLSSPVPVPSSPVLSPPVPVLLSPVLSSPSP